MKKITKELRMKRKRFGRNVQKQRLVILDARADLLVFIWRAFTGKVAATKNAAHKKNGLLGLKNIEAETKHTTNVRRIIADGLGTCRCSTACVEEQSNIMSKRLVAGKK